MEANIFLRLSFVHFLLLFHVTGSANQPTFVHAHFQASIPTLFHPYRKPNANQLAVNKGQNCM